MATKLEKLQFQIGVQDKASAQIGRMHNTIRKAAGTIQKHFKGMGIAGAAAYAAGQSIKALVAPAVEMNRALAHAGHEGADAEALRLLQQEAGKLAIQYGISANEVIRSSVNMQQALHDLSARELADFTATANLLAKAGRSSVENTTAYMGSMYGIFTAQANRMGKSRWAEILAGQTDLVAKTFHTKSEELAASFTALGNKGVKAGIDAGEQMAVLAALQKDMGGADAGKGYAAILAGAEKAQRRLGMSFKDSQGNMLAMPEILDKIKAKYGDTLTEAQQAQLGKVFGDENAGKALNALLKQGDKLSKAVTDVKKVTSLAGVRERARANSDAFARWNETVGYLRASFMQKLLPTLERWTNKATDNLAIVSKWVDKYPNVARVLGYVGLALVSVAGVVGVLTAAYHLHQIASIALGAQWKSMLGLVKLLGAGFAKLGAIMLANPIIAVIAGIALAIGMVIFYWNDLKAYFADTSWGAPLIAVMEMLEERWNMVTSLFTDYTWTKLLKLVISSALLPLEGFVNSIGWLLDKVGIEAGKDLKNWKASEFAESLIGGGAPAVDAPQGPVIQSLASNSAEAPLDGGIINTANSKTTNQNKSTHIAEQHIHLETAPPDLAEQLALAHW